MSVLFVTHMVRDHTTHKLEFQRTHTLCAPSMHALSEYCTCSDTELQLLGFCTACACLAWVVSRRLSLKLHCIHNNSVAVVAEELKVWNTHWSTHFYTTSTASYTIGPCRLKRQSGTLVLPVCQENLSHSGVTWQTCLLKVTVTCLAN